jgi:ribosome-binding ATPase
MGFNCGIVGLPNVGKSTLFNALTATAAAEAANYPFCTIEPNSGRVPVPDSRLEKVHALTTAPKCTPTHLEFVDIAGLVRGASKGEGLGNQFLGHIREVDAIVHVVRCFQDDNVTHVDGSIDPVRDMEVVATELLLADLDSLERRAAPLTKKAPGGDKEATAQLKIIAPVLEALRQGKPARALQVSKEDARAFNMLHLLSAKPVLYVCNVDEASAATGNAHSAAVAARAAEEGAACVVISADIESEIAQLTDADERQEFLETLDLEETGLDQVIRAGYALLNLVTFFSTGKEVRAWTVADGTLAPQAAGVIHTDFERGFIRAEIISYEDLIACGGEAVAKETGKMRQEGRDYRVRDGDVILFRFNV